MSSTQTPTVIDEGTDHPNYGELDAPEDKPPADYTYHERRAAIHDKMAKQGTPFIAESQTDLAAEFDVTQQQISKDIDRIRESMRERIGDGAKEHAQLFFMKAVRELQEQGEWYKAAQVMKIWNEWLFNVGALDKAPDKQEIQHSGHVEHDHEHTLDEGTREKLAAAKEHAEADAAPLMHSTTEGD